jgi:ribonuclease G
MQQNEHKQLVFDKMKNLLDAQKSRHNVLPLSKFGLMQITRQRVRPEMNIDTTEKCPTCKGTGEISPSILLEKDIEIALVNFLEKEKSRYVHLRLHPYIASYLKHGFLSIKFRWMLKYRCFIKITSSSVLNFLDYKFVNATIAE